jgi:hypothetical protein
MYGSIEDFRWNRTAAVSAAPAKAREQRREAKNWPFIAPLFVRLFYIYGRHTACSLLLLLVHDHATRVLPHVTRHRCARAATTTVRPPLHAHDPATMIRRGKHQVQPANRRRPQQNEPRLAYVSKRRGRRSSKNCRRRCGGGCCCCKQVWRGESCCSPAARKDKLRCVDAFFRSVFISTCMLLGSDRIGSV